MSSRVLAGVIGGTDEYMQKGNGAVNTAAAEQAKAANVPKFVYVSVASIVPAAVDGGCPHPTPSKTPT